MPTQNLGIAPPDAGTDVGLLRYICGDTSYEPVDPPVGGYNGDYALFSDVALQVFIDRATPAGGEPDLDLAAAYAFRQIGDKYAQESVSVQTDDLRVDLTKRATFFYARADKIEEDLKASVDIFELADFGPTCHCDPELAARTVCRCRW